MREDRRGIAVTTESAEALLHLDAATRSFLGHRADAAQHLDRVFAADRTLAVAHCFAGFAQMLLGRSELFAKARICLVEARRSLAERGGTAREWSLCRALSAWLDGNMESCADHLDRCLADAPLDALAFKLVHAVRFMLGDAVGMRLAAETVLPAWSAAIPDYGYILGCHAFALEETGSLDAAERTAREAVEREPLDAWGCHAMAHVFEASGRPADGIAWLASHHAPLAGVNNFAHHLAWHAALFHLARGNIDAVLELYDRDIRAVRTDDFRDVANAASLLWRLERAQVDIGERWEELADIAERRIGDHALVFAQLHYLMCLVGARRWKSAADMLSALQSEAVRGGTTQARVLAQIGLPMAAAILGSPQSCPAIRDDAARQMRPLIRLLGGSETQRDVFERALAERDPMKRPGPVVHAIRDARTKRGSPADSISAGM
jgi:tetratricopeptide (TPR) repeat protein